MTSLIPNSDRKNSHKGKFEYQIKDDLLLLSTLHVNEFCSLIHKRHKDMIPCFYTKASSPKLHLVYFRILSDKVYSFEKNDIIKYCRIVLINSIYYLYYYMYIKYCLWETIGQIKWHQLPDVTTSRSILVIHSNFFLHYNAISEIPQMLQPV